MIKVVGDNKIKPLIEKLTENVTSYIIFRNESFDIQINISNQTYHKKIYNINNQFINAQFDTNKISELENKVSFNELILIIINDLVNTIYETSLIYNFDFSKYQYEQKTIDIFIKNKINLTNLNKYWITSNKLYLKKINLTNSPFEFYNYFNNEILPNLRDLLDQNYYDPLFSNLKMYNLSDKPKQAALLNLRGFGGFVLRGISVVDGVINLFKKNESGNESVSILDTLEEITDDEINYLKNYADTKKILPTQTKTIFNLKNKIDKYAIPLSLHLEQHYLRLDDAYLKHSTGDHNHKINLTQMKQNFRNNKLRYLNLSHYNSKHQFNKSLQNKEITFSNGILLLCYWRLYYYHNDLYNDLNRIKGNVSPDELTNILIHYYEFIRLDLESAIEDYLNKIVKLYTDNINKNDKDLSNQFYKKRMDKRDAFEAIQSDLCEHCIELVHKHFNLNPIKAITKEYILTFYKQELMVHSLNADDVDISFYL